MSVLDSMKTTTWLDDSIYYASSEIKPVFEMRVVRGLNGGIVTHHKRDY